MTAPLIVHLICLLAQAGGLAVLFYCGPYTSRRDVFLIKASIYSFFFSAFVFGYRVIE